MSGLREAFDQIAADVPVYGDLDRAIEQADRERRQRYGVLAALAAAAAVVAVVVGVRAVTPDDNGAPEPVGPSPTPTQEASQTTAPVTPMLNGRLTTVDQYLAEVRPPCDDCFVSERAFDQQTGALLVAWQPLDGSTPTDVSVIGRDGRVAQLPCPGDLDCDPATLGPGPAELSVEVAYHEIGVIDFDGAVKDTVDLSDALDGESVQGLAWSPDGTRLAVTTRESTGRSFVANVWLVDPGGGDPLLVHTAASSENLDGNLAYIWSLAWSPDGTKLGFIEEHAALAGGFEESLSIQAVSLLLPGPGQEGPGAATGLYDYATRPHDAAAVLWSPDGTRVAVRVPRQVLELSAEDGSTLARHPLIGGHPIWPARQP